MSPPEDIPELTLRDRLAFAAFGALTGAVYGVLLWGAAFAVTDASHPSLIRWSAMIFGVLGFFFENVVGNAFLALVHVAVGFLLSEANQDHTLHPRNDPLAYVLLILGTGLVMSIALV